MLTTLDAIVSALQKNLRQALNTSDRTLREISHVAILGNNNRNPVIVGIRPNMIQCLHEVYLDEEGVPCVNQQVVGHDINMRDFHPEFAVNQFNTRALNRIPNCSTNTLSHLREI